MTPRFRQGLAGLVGFVLLGAFSYGLFVAVRAAVEVLASLDSDIAVAIIAAAATAFVSVLSIVLGKAYESRAVVRREHRERKIPVYEDLIKFMFRILMGSKTGEVPTEKEMLEFMSDFNQRMMVWGADDVLASWVRWRRAATDAADLKVHPMKLMLLYEKVILTIRRDLGHKNRNLHTGDILALFVNDIDEQLKEGGN
jgi:hypothetical protein